MPVVCPHYSICIDHGRPLNGLLSARGLIQVVGGMDLFFYIWSLLFLMGPRVGAGGIKPALWETTINLYVQCVVDDTIVWAAVAMWRVCFGMLAMFSWLEASTLALPPKNLTRLAFHAAHTLVFSITSVVDSGMMRHPS